MPCSRRITRSSTLAWLPAGVILFAAGSLGCSRTSLSVDRGSGDAGVGWDADDDTGMPPEPPPPPCYLSLVSPAAIPLISFPEGHTDAPGMVVLDPGASAGSGRSARIAYQAISEDASFWHPELRIAGLRVDPPWPEGVIVEKPPFLAGIDAHAWGKIAPGAGGGIALSWFRGDEAAGKPAGLKFRPIDTGSWVAGTEVFVDPTGSVSYGFVAGRTKATQGGGGYQGEGYAVAYRGHFAAETGEPRVAVLDPAGAVVIGPFPFASLEPYPGRAGDVVWTGETYLVTALTGACGAGGPPCVPDSVVVARIRPPANGTDPGGLELASAIAVSIPEAKPRRPVLGSHAGSVWLAWLEKETEGETPPHAVRFARLNAQGHLSASPETLATGIYPATGLSILASDVGVVVMWGKDKQPDLPSGTPGHSRLVVHHRDRDGGLLGPPLSIDSTAFAYVPAITTAALSHPRSVLVTWAGNEASEWERSITFLSRLDCHEVAAP